ncbi:unnamed protein product [Schistosoma spindalis]|nr:unnamed protein product [Schistosoma spindale]
MSIHFNQSNFDLFHSNKFLYKSIQTIFNDQLNHENTSILNNNHFNQSIYDLNNYKLLCNICNNLLNFNQFIDLMIHLQNQHIITYYRCHGCEETFTDQIQCLIHILYHHITTTKSIIQEDDTTINLNTSSSSSSSSSSSISSSSSNSNNSSNTITHNDNNIKKSVSFNENENTSCKYQYLNSTHNNSIQLHDISTNSDLIYTNNTNNTTNTNTTNTNNTNNNSLSYEYSNRQESVKLNQTTDNHLINNESSINQFHINNNCHIQSFIHFLTMLFWPNLWSINWIQSDIDSILNKHLNKDINQYNINMISNIDECTRSLTSSTTLSSSSSSSAAASSASSSSSSLSIPSMSSLHFQENNETHGLTHNKLVDMVTSDQIKCNKINESIISNEYNQFNEKCTQFQQTTNCIYLLHSHPVLRLLPYEIASKLDSYKASKICHLCLKEFTDEMTVLHHQVEEHSLEDHSNMSNFINKQNSLFIN